MEDLPKLTINKTLVNKIDDEDTKELRKELASKDEAIINLQNQVNELANKINILRP